MNCPKCGREMHNLGNIDGVVFTSNPPAWLEIWACHSCRIKIHESKRGELPPDYSFLGEYEEVKNA